MDYHNLGKPQSFKGKSKYIMLDISIILKENLKYVHTVYLSWLNGNGRCRNNTTTPWSAKDPTSNHAEDKDHVNVDNLDIPHSLWKEIRWWSISYACWSHTEI